MRHLSWTLLALLVLVVAAPARATGGRRSDAGPFVALRDANGRPLLAWGSDGLVRRADRLGYGAVILTARAVQHRSLEIPGVRIVRGCGYRDRGTRVASTYAAAQVRRCAPQMAALVRDGVPVLVTCAMGQNRSALMTARIRHLVTGEAGADLVAAMRFPGDGHRSFINRAFRRIARRWPATTRDRGDIQLGPAPASERPASN